MAVVNTLSTTVTNLDANPAVQNPAYKHHGRLRESIEYVTIASGDSTGSTFRLFRCWSGWRVSELLLDSPDIGTTTVADVGLYDTALNGGAVVDADFFGSAVSLKDGAVVKSDVVVESAVVTLTNRTKRIYEQLGLTTDPGKYYDVVLTLTGDADAGGSVLGRMRYVDGS